MLTVIVAFSDHSHLLWFPFYLRDGGSCLRLNDDPDVKL